MQIRNRGTIGGSLAHADPAAELPGVVLACDAEIHLQSPFGTRTVVATDFFDGVFTTAVAAGELIVRIVFPAWPNTRRWGFREVSRREGDFAMVGVAGWYDSDNNGRIGTARLAAIGAGDTPVRLPAAEAALTGNAPTDDIFAAAAAAAMNELRPGDDLHATAAYRREVGGVLVGRVLGDARDRRT